MKKLICLMICLIVCLFTIKSIAGDCSISDSTKIKLHNQQVTEQKKAIVDIPERYVLENQFILLCDYMSNTNLHVKLGIDELTQIVVYINQADRDKADVLYKYLIGLQVGLQRVGTVLWWDNCVWHSDSWAVSTATSNMNSLFEVAMPKEINSNGIRDSKRIGFIIHATLKK